MEHKYNEPVYHYEVFYKRLLTFKKVCESRTDKTNESVYPMQPEKLYKFKTYSKATAHSLSANLNLTIFHLLLIKALKL